MSEEEEAFILCMRKSDTTRLTIVSEGSTLTNCCECDEPVWISPASVQVMLERNCKPLCMWCAADKPPAKEVKPPSAEQLKEIIKELQKEVESWKHEDPTDRFTDSSN